MYTEIYKCRICGNDNLIPVLNLGNQYLTGVFPNDKQQKITCGPLELIKCHNTNDNFCGLVQLRHNYNLSEMYGLNYGYRSGLNKSMVNHLHKKVHAIVNSITLTKGDLIIDIGSNDSTLLKAYPKDEYLLVGIDPTGIKFKKYYPQHILLFPDFFSSDIIKDNFGSQKAKVITSIAMFYDLESPLTFMHQIYDILADDGIWLFEQSYLPDMIKMNSYDTICHEHLEYYCLQQIKWMTDRAGFKINDIEFNNVNGGSFSVMVSKKNSPYQENTGLIDKILAKEQEEGLNSLEIYEKFKQRICKHREDLHNFIKKVALEGKKIFGYGASTKGNVILQFCNLTEKDIPYIAEINDDKIGCYTPGTYLPIISEKEAKAMAPDYFLVLPWHLKENIIVKEKKYFLMNGGALVFPLPELVIVKQ